MQVIIFWTFRKSAWQWY